jgi:hypothetical protein
VTLKQSGNLLQGTMNADGYIYSITATSGRNTARGHLKDVKLGGTVEIDLRLKGNALVLTMHAVNPQTGQRASVPLTFTRGRAPAKPGSTGVWWAPGARASPT